MTQLDDEGNRDHRAHVDVQANPAVPVRKVIQAVPGQKACGESPARLASPVRKASAARPVRRARPDRRALAASKACKASPAFRALRVHKARPDRKVLQGRAEKRDHRANYRQSTRSCRGCT